VRKSVWTVSAVIYTGSEELHVFRDIASGSGS
jgi:hypothetical protein